MFNKMILLMVCLFAAPGLTGCPGTACLGIDTCQLQGTWEASFSVGSSTTVTDQMIITGDSIVYATLTNGFEGAYRINALTDPKQIDFMITKSWVGLGLLQVVDNTPKTKLGIYAVSKDVLTVQFDDESTRPAAFDSDEMVTLAHISTS